ncbi:DUF1330 domain-containing protein [Polaromonas sp.]|uniref:DUF1330 domain-containing protein n=1 Tax=Polaromonas sp. TaxID=1869339 RepID=UPI00286D38CA|nr:DUF1330 domain-containing protein [Polaromonas sp.]
MPAAYFVLHNRIVDAQKMQDYIPKALETLAAYQAEILVFDENATVMEGSTSLPRMILIRFDSRATATAWYNSPAYQAVLPLRLDATEGFAMMVENFVPAAR